jgi:hypothetical protein
MRSHRSLSSLVLCLIASGLAAAAGEGVPVTPGSSVVHVDCDAGDDLARVMTRVSTSRTPVEIEVEGTCRSCVLIDRNDVIVRGGESGATLEIGEDCPSYLVREGGTVLTPAVYVVNAVGVELRNLNIVGGEVQYDTGVMANQAEVDLHGVSISGPDFGLVTRGSFVSAVISSIEGWSTAVATAEASFTRLNLSEVVGDINLIENSSIDLLGLDCRVTGTTQISGGRLQARAGTVFENWLACGQNAFCSITTRGAIPGIASNSSKVLLNGNGGSVDRVYAGELGAVLVQGVVEVGVAECADAAEVFCEDGIVADSSNCGGCPGNEPAAKAEDTAESSGPEDWSRPTATPFSLDQR